MKKLYSLIICLCLLAHTSSAQTIAEIQGTGDATPFMDQQVTTSGIVTALGSQGYFLQDGTDVRSGIYVFDSSNSPNVGDAVTMTATAVEFFDLTELKTVTAFEVTSTGNPLPETIKLTTGTIANEDYESMLIELESAVCTDTDLGFGEWQVDDGSGPARVDDLLFLFSPDLDLTYNIQGPLFYSFENYKIIPRTASDIVIDLPLYFTESPKEWEINQTDLSIRWMTNAPAFGEITYGLTPDLELGTVAAFGMNTLHEVLLTDLTPATIYYVRPVSNNDDGQTPSHTFVVCTASTSSGQIKTYFNHEVDHSVATDELAVSTDHIIDTITYYIDQAQSTLDVTMFEIENQAIIDAINAAHNRGVQVRYISDIDEETNNAVLENLDENIPLLKGNSEGIMHDKFIIIDREDADKCWVMTGSMNHTEANLGWDYNNVICLQDQSLARAYTLEFNEMWGSDEASPNPFNAKFGSEKTDNTPHCFILRDETIPVTLYFSPTDNAGSQIKKALESAENEIAFATLIFTENSLGTTIRNAHDEGINVRGIIDYVESNGSEFNFLTSNGVNVVDYQNADGSQWPDGPTLHHKYAIIDYLNGGEPKVITGSHNWTASANSIHDENTLIIYDATLANIYYQEFSARFDALTSTIDPLRRLPLRLYPNPTADVLRIDIPEAGELRLSNSTGQVVWKEEVAPGTQTLQLGQLPAGMYYLRMNEYVGKVMRY